MNKNFLALAILSLSVLAYLLFLPNHNLSIPSSLPPSSFSPTITPTSSQNTTLLAVGDIMLGRHCQVVTQQKQNPLYPFLKIAEFTSKPDLSFANLEAPFFENCPSTSTGMVFCTKPQFVQGLVFAGFDILSLANNHILNYGIHGFKQTIEILEKNQIHPICSSCSNLPDQFLIINKNDTKFGFLAYDLVTYPNLASIIPLKVNQLSPQVDVLIVSLHWGNEYQTNPTTQQKNLAHDIIQNGAKIILGHHPHVIQPEEKYLDGLIFYSLGNFVFDQTFSQETQKGLAVLITFQKNKILNHQAYPIQILKYCQPSFQNQPSQNRNQNTQ